VHIDVRVVLWLIFMTIALVWAMMRVIQDHKSRIMVHIDVRVVLWVILLTITLV